MILNNWHAGGKYKYRGFRPRSCTVGAEHSMHREGKAADFTIKGVPAGQVRVIIRANSEELMRLGLTRIETGISWVHIDLKETGLDYIKEFRP